LQPSTGAAVNETAGTSPRAAPIPGLARPEVQTRDSTVTEADPSSDWSRDDQRWAAWMSAAQLGDKQAYEQLLTEVAATIRQYLHVRFGPAEFIDDIMQECLLSMHNRFGLAVKHRRGSHDRRCQFDPLAAEQGSS
jgi:hypothetical protein